MDIRAIQEATIEAIIVRKDGTVENLGVIATSEVEMACHLCGALVRTYELADHVKTCELLQIADQLPDE